MHLLCLECKTVKRGVLPGGVTCVFPYTDCSPQAYEDSGNWCMQRTKCLPRYEVGSTPAYYVCSLADRYDDKTADIGECEEECPKEIP